MRALDVLVKDLKPEWTADAPQSSGEYLERFLEELEEARNLFDWKLLPDSLAPDTRRKTRHRLRGICRKGPGSGTTFEPVGAVCYARTGAVYGEDAWSGAARALGLPSLCVAELIAAANDHTWIGPGSGRAPVEHLRELRVRLIRAVGLRRKSAD